MRDDWFDEAKASLHVWDRRSELDLFRTIAWTPVCIGNKAAITIGQNNTSRTFTKHIPHENHYVRDSIAAKIIEPICIKTDDNPVDMFTEPVSVDKFEKHRKSLGTEFRPAWRIRKKGSYIRSEVE